MKPLNYQHTSFSTGRNIFRSIKEYTVHFAHVYSHCVIQDGGPRRRGRITRNWDFASSFTTTKQKSKEITKTKKEKYMGSQSSSCTRTLSWIYLWSRETVYCTNGYIFVQLLPVFLQIQLPFFVFLERDRTLLSCFSADRKTADILMFVLMLMYDRFTHVT